MREPSEPDDRSKEELAAELRLLDRGEGLASIERLTGGGVCEAWLLTYANGESAVAKTLRSAPEGMFEVEAEGLEALRATATVQIPEVLAVGRRLILLEQLAPLAGDGQAWDEFAHDLAALHRGSMHDRFGWHHDGFFGPLPQHNPWTDDGHAFFAEHRVLRYLQEPLAEQALTASDRRAVELLCARLTELVPPMSPVLTHGDLGSYNILAGSDGRLAVIDPAVSYGWAEVDLATLYCFASYFEIPPNERFFALYQELNPSPAGWRERLPLLLVRDLLLNISFIPAPDSAWFVERLRRTLARHYPT